MDPTTLLILVAVLAVLIIAGTGIAIVRVLRMPDAPASPQPAAATVSNSSIAETETLPPFVTDTGVTTDSDDLDAYLAEQKANLGEFQLGDLSNSFKGVTQESQRNGVVLRHDDPDTGVIAFTSQVFNPQNALVNADTVYGNMEIIVTQGKAGVKWEGNPLGVLDFANQRILGGEGQLLGSMERPPVGSNDESYEVGFFGQKAADVVMRVNAVSTLRWFDNEADDQMPAFHNLSEDLEDNQTLILVAILLLEIGYMDLVSKVA